MLGDRATAEDVVQDAFCGLYRHWGQLSDPAKALSYARASTLNGCRSELRHRLRAQRRGGPVPDAADAASGSRPRCSARSTGRYSAPCGGCRTGSGRR
jgi:DNA-directed RNA polymerase specialized sigma24 family protein